MTMVVGMFESLSGAQRAVTDLVDSGYRRNAISVLVRHASNALPVLGTKEAQGALARATDSAHALGILAGGPLGVALGAEKTHATESAVMATLANAGLNPAAARFFADAICHGAILVAVHCAERELRDAREILDTYSEVLDDFAHHPQAKGGSRVRPS